MSITVNKLRIRCGPHVSNDTNYRVMSYETYHMFLHCNSDCSWRDSPWLSHSIPGTAWPCNMFQLFNVYRHVAVTWHAKCGTLEVFCYSSLSTDKILGFVWSRCSPLDKSDTLLLLIPDHLDVSRSAGSVPEILLVFWLHIIWPFLSLPQVSWRPNI
jgi:hypothetical protein